MPVSRSMLEEQKKISLCFKSTHDLKAFIVIFCMWFVRSKFRLSLRSNCKRVNSGTLSMRWKQLLCACTVQTFLLKCLALQSWKSTFFSCFPPTPALIKSDLRRHNVNSGIMNMDAKPVSDDSFTLIILLYLHDDFYWHNNINIKRAIDKNLLCDCSHAILQWQNHMGSCSQACFSHSFHEQSKKLSAIRLPWILSS